MISGNTCRCVFPQRNSVPVSASCVFGTPRGTWSPFPRKPAPVVDPSPAAMNQPHTHIPRPRVLAYILPCRFVPEWTWCNALASRSLAISRPWDQQNVPQRCRHKPCSQYNLPFELFPICPHSTLNPRSSRAIPNLQPALMSRTCRHYLEASETSRVRHESNMRS